MNDDQNISIIGCGVIGLSIGITLLENGFKQVTIVSENFPPHTTSNIAAAIWRPTHAKRPHITKWCEASLEKLAQLAQDPLAGIRYITRTEFFKNYQVPDWARFLPITSSSFQKPDQYHTQISYHVPLMDTTIYIPYLVERFKNLGGRLMEKKLRSLDEIKGAFIINCAGLGAKELAHDSSVFPIRGQVVVIEKPQELNESLAAPEEYIYLIPRHHDCIIGGTEESNDWSLAINPATAKSIIEKASILWPALKQQKIIGHKVGLRPGRPIIRLEKATLPSGQTIIHNYGHGGSGHTLSWGCALEILDILNGLL